MAPVPESPRVTRLAPSPTGALHLGNARTFVVNWVLARQRGWRVAIRVEDLDTPRVKAGAADGALETLAWLGLDWDGPILSQSEDLEPYRSALRSLLERGLVYPCRCTRREIEAAQSAPHGDEHELRYPGICRPDGCSVALASAEARHSGGPLDEAGVAWRVLGPHEPVVVKDELRGDVTFDVAAEVGDFVVASKAGLPAYQLAVVVDDARQGVTEVVRGDDLFSSAARQMHLYRLLGVGPVPRYYHLPLVLGEDGRRLAKRHGDTRLSTYRERGVRPERVLGLLAGWSGVTQHREEVTLAEWLERFRLDAMPRRAVTFTQENEAWLIDG